MAAKSIVAIVRCSSYEQGEVARAVGRAVSLLGGIGRFISAGERILIKPNMLAPHAPEKAVTTHPAVVEAVAGLVKEAGASASIGDSPGFYAFRRVAEASGIKEAAARSAVPLVPFEDEKSIDTADGSLMKKIVIARQAAECDGIVSVPKFKTHGLTCITAALKNPFGCVPGLKKAEMHLRFPATEPFSRMLVDIVRSLPLRLHILDAVAAMDGNGPAAGNPFAMKLIIAGADPVAVDSTACRAVGVDPLSIPLIRIGAERGAGFAAVETIETVGEDISSVGVSGFRSVPPPLGPGRLLPIPEFLAARLKNWFVPRPRFLHDVCTRCGACVGICPARPKALSMRGGRVSIDDRACILCYCCNETCPAGAIRLKRGFAAAALARIMKL